VTLGQGSLRRYSRHLLIPEVGVAGQAKLAAARVLVVGAGGLGSPVLAYLAAAGVGRIGICDDDTVDETNLQRQVLFAQRDVGRAKVEVAAERVAALNGGVAVDRIPLRLDASNARDLIRLYDAVVDATDRFETRYLINDAAYLEGRPDVFGSIFRFDGQVSVFGEPGPCYRCLFPEAPPDGSVPTCAEGGVLGALAGIVGTWQASEVLKLLLGAGRPLRGRLMLVDALDARVREIAIPRDPACALCGPQASIRSIEPERYEAGVPVSAAPEIEAAELDAYLEAAPAAVLLDVREPHEAVLGLHPRALHLPASQLEARMHELDSAREYVVACRVGSKSRWAAARLHDAGFGRLRHLRDGLLAYAAAQAAFEMF
jgi:adenylyltransferase/sulfurtransferase